MVIKKIEWQRDVFEDAAGTERELSGCPITQLDNFAALMVLFNQHIDASDDDATIEQLYENNDHFKEIANQALIMCGIDLMTISHNSIAELLHSYMDEKDGAFYPGRLVQINFPYSKKYRFSPLEDMEEQIYPDITNLVEELTDAVELIEELKKADGSSSNDDV